MRGRPIRQAEACPTGQALFEDGRPQSAMVCPTAKWRPERPPQAESLPHEKSL